MFIKYWVKSYNLKDLDVKWTWSWIFRTGIFKRYSSFNSKTLKHINYKEHPIVFVHKLFVQPQWMAHTWMHMPQIREDGEDLEAVSYFQNLQYLCVTRTALWRGQLGTSVPIRPFISLDLNNLTVKKTIYHLEMNYCLNLQWLLVIQPNATSFY